MTIALRRVAIVATVLLLPACLLSGCTSLSPESRLRAGLEGAGLSPRMARCMAGRMVDRLSLAQLQKLRSLASLRKSHSNAMAIDQLLHQLRALRDPEVLAVTSASALACAF